MNLNDLFKLSGDNGKLVFIDESGQVKGVFLTAEEYLALSESKEHKTPSKPPVDPEQINRQILTAQLHESSPELDVLITENTEQSGVDSAPKSISELLASRADELLMSKPFGRSAGPMYDLRQEVIDPDFGKEESIDTDTEEIKPKFDDI